MEMDQRIIEAIVFAVPLVIAAAAVAVMMVSIRRDPRWLGNAYLTMVAVAMVLMAISTYNSTGAAIIGVIVFLGLILSPVLILAIIGFLIVNGIITIRREGARLANALPLLLGLALLVAAVCFFAGVANSAVTTAVAVWLFLACSWLAFLMFCMVVYGFVYAAVVRRRPFDYVVVLGSGLRSDGTVTPLLAQRVDKGLAVQARQATRGREVPIVMSGGKGSDEVRSEAEAMRDHALAQGADPELVMVETASTNTEQNLRNSGELVLARPGMDPASRGMIVSSNYHTLRAATLARELGLPLQATGAPVAFFYWPTAALREFVALVKPHLVAHLIVAALVTLPIPALLLVSATVS